MNISLIKFLTTLKMYSNLKKEFLIYKNSKQVLYIIGFLYKEGFIQSFKLLKNDFILIILRFYFNKPILKNLKFVSTPSKNKNLKFNTISKLKEKKYIYFFSTNQGVLTATECKKRKIGGKILFYC